MTEYKRGNVIICVSRTVLTDEERLKREQRIIASLQEFGKAEVKKVTS